MGSRVREKGVSASAATSQIEILSERAAQRSATSNNLGLSTFASPPIQVFCTNSSTHPQEKGVLSLAKLP
jgi:hypothetical protein